MHDSEGYWKVRMMVKPWYKILEWKGVAASSDMAKTFARKAITDEGHTLNNINLISIERVE